jgi:HAE1 family hydrophobic/amphiphilic exporter-1
VLSVFMVPLLGTEFVPKADFSETTVNFYTPVGSSLEATEAKARQVEGILREFPEVRYTLATINTGSAQGKMYASIYVRLVDRKDRSRSVDHVGRAARAPASRCQASPSPMWACWTRWVAKSRWSSRCRGLICRNWSA